MTHFGIYVDALSTHRTILGDSNNGISALGVFPQSTGHPSLRLNKLGPQISPTRLLNQATWKPPARFSGSRCQIQASNDHLPPCHEASLASTREEESPRLISPSFAVVGNTVDNNQIFASQVMKNEAMSSCK